MAAWQTASGVFFAYIAVVAMSVRRLPPAKRSLALAGAAAGLVVVAAATLTQHPLLNDWVVPPAVLLVAYWTSGLLFVAPMARVERALLRFDDDLQVRRLAAAAPRAVAELLEAAYAAIYPVIPVALFVYLTATEAPDSARFWTVILITDYICFGMLPWIQTRPPRALEPGHPWTSGMRTVNLRLLGKTSIHVNTFPSGHAAEALAAALLVAEAPVPVALAMLCTAAAISAGAVLGRYHYSADVIAGWFVAVVVWMCGIQGLR